MKHRSSLSDFSAQLTGGLTRTSVLLVLKMVSNFLEPYFPSRANVRGLYGIRALAVI